MMDMDEIIRRMEAAAQVQPQPRKEGNPLTARWLGTLCSNCMRPEQRPDQHPYCPDRCAGCGATCARWAAYTAERDAMYEVRRKESMAWGRIAEHVEKAMEKCKRRKP